MLLNVVLKKTLESPLDCKEIKPVHPKGNQSWIFTGRTEAEAETPIPLATWWEELSHWKRPWCWERLKAGGEGDDRGWDGWMASPTQWTWVWASSRSGDGHGGLVCCSPWGHKESDMTEWLNWTELMFTKKKKFLLPSPQTKWPVRQWRGLRAGRQEPSPHCTDSASGKGCPAASSVVSWGLRKLFLRIYKLRQWRSQTDFENIVTQRISGWRSNRCLHRKQEAVCGLWSGDLCSPDSQQARGFKSAARSSLSFRGGESHGTERSWNIALRR